MMYKRSKTVYNITQDDYKFIERPEDTMYTVELLTSAYAGTKYQYSKVSAKVNEDEENEGTRSNKPKSKSIRTTNSG